MNDIGVIYLTNGGFTIVDADLFGSLNQFKWQKSSNGAVYRGSGTSDTRSVYMHRVVNNTPEGVHTDHKNGFKLDNTRRNLRNATKSTNAANSTPRKRLPSSPYGSKYKGVFRRPDCKTKPWKARIGCRDTCDHLGGFDTPEEAALAYNKAALARWGEYAKLNVLEPEGQN